LAATLSVLAGGYRLGKRQIKQLAVDLFGLSVSTGMICKLERKTAEILEPVHQELSEHVRTQDAGGDETGWRENKQRAWLWVVTTPLVIVFTIARSRGGSVARRLLGETFSRVLTCDRWGAYRSFRRLQWCWAHLRRDFQAMIDRGGPGKRIGENLLAHSDTLFTYWHRVRDGTLARSTFQNYVRELRAAFVQDLLEGSECGCAKTAATCANLFEDEQWLWTFVYHEGIEPTNNAAERAQRHAVQWRRSSGGTASEAGSRYVERMLTAIATCRQQGRNLLDYLTQCHECALRKLPVPSLLPSQQRHAAA
jgi:transposase